MLVLVDNQFAKGIVLLLFWLVWFQSRRSRDADRRLLLATLPAPFIAFFVGRLLAKVLPFRARPFTDATLHWRFAEGFDTHQYIRHWSSLPSDHAACFAAAILPILLVAPRMGLLGAAYVLLIIDLPRIYLGLHNPSDVLAGTLVGFAVAAVMAWRPIRERLARPFMGVLVRSPGLFYAGVFVCLFAIGSINAIHQLADAGVESVHAWATHHAEQRALLHPAPPSPRAVASTLRLPQPVSFRSVRMPIQY